MKKYSVFVIGMATLLMGAHGVDQTLDDLPSCAANTYLVFRSGKLVCEPTLPDCAGQLLQATGGGLAGLSCTPKNADALTSAERQRALALQEQLQSLSAQLDALGLAPQLAATWVGITKATTTGRITSPGSDSGLPAANARCAAEFGTGSHMCAMPEILGAVLSSNSGTLLDPRTDVSPAWLYMPTWNVPTAGAQLPLSGLADNCGGYTDDDAAKSWSGMAVDWSLSVYAERVVHFDSGPLAPCNQPLPIACCQ